MNKRRFVDMIFQRDSINFVLTNHIPRRLCTLFYGWFSRIEHPWIAAATIAVWRFFADDLDLNEAEQQVFKSANACFTRALKPGMRPIHPDRDMVTSPCDAIVGAHGQIEGNHLFQAKGQVYKPIELFGSPSLAQRYRSGLYITLRLKSSMYHRFHAPYPCRLYNVSYISGETWNVNPPTLRRIERLFCKNERAVLDLHLAQEGHLTLVAVAAILVASIQLHCLPKPLDLRYRGPNQIPCKAAYDKGDEMGYFQHGSTIILFASEDFDFHPSIAEGMLLRMGQPLLCKRPQAR